MSKVFWKDEFRKTGEVFGVSVDDFDTEAAWEQRFCVEVKRRKQERLKNDPVFAKMISEIEKDNRY